MNRNQHRTSNRDLDREASAHADSVLEKTTASAANPGQATTGRMTAPRLGSAPAGGFELEPRPERD